MFSTQNFFRKLKNGLAKIDSYWQDRQLSSKCQEDRIVWFHKQKPARSSKKFVYTKQKHSWQIARK